MTNNSNHGKGNIAIIAILILLLSVVIGVGFNLKNQNSTKQGILSEVSKQITNNYGNIVVKNEPWLVQQGSGMSVIAPEQDFAISSQSLPSLYFELKGVTNKELPQAKTLYDIKHTIQKKLKKDGYASLYLSPDVNLFTNDNSEGNKKCLSFYGDRLKVLTLTCYDTSSIAAVGETLTSLVEVYKKAEPTYVDSFTYFGPLTIKSKKVLSVIKASKTPGYGIAEMVITQKGDTNKQIALFYNRHDGDWKYITQASDETSFSCSPIAADPEAAKAMSGQPCRKI